MTSRSTYVSEVVFTATLLIACRAIGGPLGVPDKSSPDKSSPDKSSLDKSSPGKLPGARGDGRTDDRVAIQAAIDRAASGTRDVYLPAGTFLISRAGNQSYGLKVPGGVRVHGAGQGKTILQQAPGTDGGVRLLFVSGRGIALEDLTLDGNKHAQTVSEQRHGVFALDTEGLRIRGVTARNFTGDGFYLYTQVNNSTLIDVVATANDRNGITLGGAIDGTLLTSSKFIGNKAQQIDSEPHGAAVVSNTWVIDNDIDAAGVSNEYVLTCSGTETATKGHGWTVAGNRINGGVFVVWAQDVVISGNIVDNSTTKSSVVVYRTSADVTILGNRLRQSAPRVAGVAILGTGAGGPERVVVADNLIETTSEQGLGVQAEGARSVVIADNVLRGAGHGARGAAAIMLRATNPAVDFERAVVKRNRISHLGGRGINIMGNGTARLRSVEITGNTFEDDSAVPSMTEGISLDDGTGAAREISVIGNKYLGGVTTEITNYPVNVPVLVGGVRGAGGRYEIAGSPEGTVAEIAGAVVVRRDRGPGPKYYIKQSGADSKTGWLSSATAPPGQ